MRLDLVEGTAVEIERGERGFAIRLASGDQYQATAVALCTGNGRSDFPLRPESVAPAARDFMIREPFADYRMAAIEPDARVLMVGTGLTMIDQVLTLDQNGHTGPILAVSPARPDPRGPSRRTDRTAADRTAGRADAPRALHPRRRRSRAEDARGGDWRSVIDGLRPRTQELWQRLGSGDQRRFFRHVEAFWSVHRHRMAPTVAERIAAHQTGGRLTFRAGRVVAVRKSADAVTVALRRRGSSTIELLPFDWIVNCSGPPRASVAADPFLRRAVAHGLVRPDPAGRGLEVSADGGVIDRRGRPVAGLYALGPLTAGRLLEITAVPDIRVQAAEIAARVAGFVRDAQKTPLRETQGRSR